jgi:nucleotide-binding universal stress UspA family protein
MTAYTQTRISNPSCYYETPNHVLSDSKLSHASKVKVLRSMAVDADQKLEATSEGMTESNPSCTAKELQSALVQLEKVKSVETMETTNLQTARFQRIMVVTTVDQYLNREIAGVAFDMAENTGAKVCLLNVVPSAFEGASLAVAGPMVAAAPVVAAGDAQIIEDRHDQLAELRTECGSNVEAETDVRSGQIEEVVVAYADEWGADLIIVGSPNRSWLEPLFDTSIARLGKGSALCPVLVVPKVI